ncbi:hypothetical protein ACXYTJ_00590 [Gilvimarinus sp. F26214L]|uniref:hypothetical protein n=1 Tax=Gilvimarinus sp. DZF01 TaxID=3461371 RepID=UPI004046391D
MEASIRTEALHPGDTVVLENTADAALSIDLVSDDGCNVKLDLAAGQQLEFSAGGSHARVILRNGDPAALLVIKPELPS